VTTLFIGDFGVGLMAAVTALVEALRAIGDPDAIVATASPGFTARCVPDVICIGPDEASPRRPSRVVLTGPIGWPAHVTPLMTAFAAASAAGATPEIHNFSLPSGVESEVTFRIAAALSGLRGSMRDHVTHLSMMRRGLDWFPSLAGYPERTMTADDSLTRFLPAGPAPVGVMLDSSPHMLTCMSTHADTFSAAFALLPDRSVLPIPPSMRQRDDKAVPDTVLAARRALLAFRPGQAPLLPALLDADWWLANATPAGVAGLVGRCAALVTTSDLGVLLAAAAGIPCHIIGLSPDDAATRAGGTLAGAMAPGSSFIVLR